MIQQSHFWAYIQTKLKSKKITCTTIFLAALFTTAETREQLNAHWQMMGREDVVHIYSGVLLSHKKSKILPSAATWMDPEISIPSEVRQTKTNIIWDHVCVESKIWYIWTHLQNRNTHKLMVTKQERHGLGDKSEVWDEQIHTTICKNR